MNGGWVFLIVVVVLIALLYLRYWNKRREFERMTPEEQEQERALRAEMRRERDRRYQVSQHGNTNSALICPHCQVAGQVRTKSISQKKGISGAKATGAVLTGGLSMLATGLSRKENLTEAHCDNCGSTWHF